LQAYEAALSLEKCNNQTLLELHKVAAQNNDPQVRGRLFFFGISFKNIQCFPQQMTDFIEEDFLRKQASHKAIFTMHFIHIGHFAGGINREAGQGCNQPEASWTRAGRVHVRQRKLLLNTRTCWRQTDTALAGQLT